ncbi:MAG: serine/threonine-protein kinase, partial [Planctomycetota bacterium]
MSDQPIDIEAVFETALSKAAPKERAAYLDEVCRNNPEARARVEALLEAHDDAGSFLEKPAAQFVPTATPRESTGDSGESFSDEQCSLDFLAPTERPGCLGTIGQYEITEVVGRGGMGIVLKGNDPKLSRVVAVKVLAPELASNASACKRFLREGRAAAAVSHDHVVTIYGIDDTGRLPFIAMEYVSGPSLEGRIKREGPLELTEILRIGMQIASGLSAAHAQGLVHRDVKPANILLENGVEKVKITDFGLARAVDDVRMTKPEASWRSRPPSLSPPLPPRNPRVTRASPQSMGSARLTSSLPPKLPVAWGGSASTRSPRSSAAGAWG